jgi:hypothetical protein
MNYFTETCHVDNSTLCIIFYFKTLFLKKVSKVKSKDNALEILGIFLNKKSTKGHLRF